MSTIYKNTFIAAILNGTINMLFDPEPENNAGTLLWIHGAVNLIEMLANKCLSVKEKMTCDKVFFSPTGVLLHGCTVVREEFSYIDTTAKGISIVIAGLTMTMVPMLKFIESHELLFTILPSAIAVIGEVADDVLGLGLSWEKCQITDQTGQYTSYEL